MILFPNAFFLFIKSKSTIDFTELVAPIDAILGSLLLVFLLCEFGGNVTKQYELFDDELWKCDWYLFPIELERKYVIFMSYTQQPAMIRGYGNVRCVRDSFKNVMTCIKDYNSQMDFISFIFFYSRQYVQLSRILWHFVKSMVEWLSNPM